MSEQRYYYDDNHAVVAIYSPLRENELVLKKKDIPRHICDRQLFEEMRYKYIVNPFASSMLLT